MFGLLSTLVNTVMSIAGFIINTFQSLFILVSSIPAYISYLVVGIGYLPSQLFAFAMVSLVLFAVLFMLDR